VQQRQVQYQKFAFFTTLDFFPLGHKISSFAIRKLWNGTSLYRKDPIMMLADSYTQIILH
jgi:hypothetical protein